MTTKTDGVAAMSAELGPLLDSEEDPARLWAEIHRLRADAQGPQGYRTWKEAATVERALRIKAEQSQAWTATADEPPPVGERVFWLDEHHNMVGYDTYFGEPYRFNSTHWMRIPPVSKRPNTQITGQQGPVHC